VSKSRHNSSSWTSIHEQLLLREVWWAVPRRRQAMGISQEELASRCKLHRTYISEIERGLKSASLRDYL
jgi:ribosome-binding protein aMBF1 (putative translation factor)